MVGAGPWRVPRGPAGSRRDHGSQAAGGPRVSRVGTAEVRRRLPSWLSFRPIAQLRTRTFLLLVTGLLAFSLVSMLALNTMLAKGQFRPLRPDESQGRTRDHGQQLQSDLTALESPQALDKKAKELGMVHNPNAAFVDISKGKVLGSPSPAPVPSSPSPGASAGSGTGGVTGNGQAEPPARIAAGGEPVSSTRIPARSAFRSRRPRWPSRTLRPPFAAGRTQPGPAIPRRRPALPARQHRPADARAAARVCAVDRAVRRATAVGAGGRHQCDGAEGRERQARSERPHRPRGTIYDVRGVPLAQSVEARNLAVDQTMITDPQHWPRSSAHPAHPCGQVAAEHDRHPPLRLYRPGCESGRRAAGARPEQPGDRR